MKQLKQPQIDFTDLKNTNKFVSISIIYFLLYVVWNIFTFWLVFKIASSQHKIIEVGIVAIVFMFNKSAFGKPLHLKEATCFIVSIIVFYIVARIIPFSSLSIVIPTLVGCLLALISSIVAFIMEPPLIEYKETSLRKRLLAILGDDIDLTNIITRCKLKGYTDDKAKEIATTIHTYLHYSQTVTAMKCNIDARTITRRINDFLT